MQEKNRETLPVEQSDLERQIKILTDTIEIHIDILKNITESLENPNGLQAENRHELAQNHKTTIRHVGELAAHITRLQQIA